MQEWYNICKSINEMHHISRIKDKTHIILSIKAEKSFNKIQHPFILKALKKLRIEGTFLNIMKAVYNKPITNIILNREKLKPLPLKSGMR
jgi:hypothetical protein